MGLVGSPIESDPPSTWTESGQTPALRKVSSSPQGREAVAPIGRCRAESFAVRVGGHDRLMRVLVPVGGPD